MDLYLLLAKGGPILRNSSSGVTVLTIHAVSQVAKEFNLLPADVLADRGVSESRLLEWRDQLRAASNAVDQLEDRQPLRTRVLESGVSVSIPGVAGRVASDVTISDPEILFGVVEDAVRILGSRELFLRTGFSVDEVMNAASVIAETVADDVTRED